MEIREILARCNQPLLKKVKSKAIGAHPTLDDQELFSEMQISLLRCIERFDLMRDGGTKFSTYLQSSLVNCLRKQLKQQQRYKENHSQLDEEFNQVASYLPKVHVAEQLSDLTNTQRQLVCLVAGISNGRSVSIRAAAKQLEIDLCVAERAYASAILLLRSGLEI